MGDGTQRKCRMTVEAMKEYVFSECGGAENAFGPAFFE